MTREVWVLLGMCVCGIGCAVLFDAFRGAHYVLKKHDVIVIISDALYWLAVCAIIIYSLWRLNNGEIRGYEFAGLGLGAALYFLTVSPYVYKFFLTINVICVKIIGYIYKILLTLRSFLYKITVAPVKGAAIKLKNKRRISGGGNERK